MLLYPGMNCGLVLTNVAEGGASARPEYLVPYAASNAISTASAVDANTAFTAQVEEDYHQWRTVSQGLRVSCLNASETDEGWWQACRVTEPLDTGDFTLMPYAKGDGSLAAAFPRTILNSFAGRNIVNERSYSTGLLRDLKNHTFSLTTTKDFHDFTTMMDSYNFGPNDLSEVETNIPDVWIDFVGGRDNVSQAMQQWIDFGMDMIYIRIHTRAPGGGPATQIHCDLVSNQEISFGSNEKESRFQTKNNAISDMDKHFHGRSLHQNGAAAHRIAA